MTGPIVDGNPPTTHFPSFPKKLLLATTEVRLGGKTIGSGVYLGGGLVATARHVSMYSSKGYKISVVFQMESETSKAPVYLEVDAYEEKVSHNYDLAILRVSNPPEQIKAATFFSGHLYAGRAIGITGSSIGLQTVPTTGYYVGRPKNKGFRPGFHLVSVQAAGGNSGGGVWDMRTQSLIGILVAGYRGYNQVNYMVDVKHLIDLMNKPG